MSSHVSSALSILAVPADKLAAIRARYVEAAAQLFSQAQHGTLPPPSDRRFSDPAWSANPVHLLNVHLYLLTVQTLREMVAAAQLDHAARERLDFTLMQWAEAASPANYLVTNPQAQKKAIETSGQSLSQGMKIFFDDLQKGRLSHTDESAFEVGRNLAITPGSVIYENPLMQLIQYAPQSDTVHQKPLLIVPPNINKYYILDLQQHNSFVNYAVQQGFTVFLISWRNPLPDDTDNIHLATWGDYLVHGILKATDVVRDVTGQDQINALGFCVGGTMLSSALAMAHARGQKPVSALTLLTSFLDFDDTGIMDVFVDELHATLRDRQFAQGGLMTAHELATTFSFLRPGELVWNYVSNGYLMGESPRPFDLLYWNSDSTNLPGPFFAWYFRNTYLENNLMQAGKVVIDGTPIDLGALDLPTYIYASERDHIVPWKSSFASTRVLPNPDRFVLGASGHVAGVINPPARKRRNFWAHAPDARHDVRLTADQWLETATEYPGSWWPDWAQWLASRSGPRIQPSTQIGNANYTEIEPAPGRYVQVRAVK